jgi:hypothetical protein
MARKYLNVQMGQCEKDNLREIAERRGITVSDAARLAIEIFTNLDDDIWAEWLNESKIFGVPVHVVIQNRYIARRIDDSMSSDDIVEDYPKLRDGTALTGSAFAAWYKKTKQKQKRLDYISRYQSLDARIAQSTGDQRERLEGQRELYARIIERLSDEEEGNDEEI